MSETARKREIIAQAGGLASEIAEALNNVAEGLTDIAAAMAYQAATQYDGMTAGEKRQTAGVIFHTACQRFGGVKYDGTPISDADVAQLDAMWTKLTGGKKLKR